MKMLLRTLIVTSVAFLGLFFAQSAMAADFDAAYAIDYRLSPDSNTTKVTQKITLTNRQPNLRANSYSLTLDSNYSNLSAYDSSGALSVSETKNDSTTTLSFTFNDKVVGVGNTLSWTIEYDSSSIAQHHGNIWDVTIPRVKEPESYNITSYVTRLHVPNSAGKENYVSPSPSATSTSNDIRTYEFGKDQVFPSGVVASFGDYQLFDFTLKYHLHNPNIGQASTEIALPPDIPGQQQIIYKDLTPKPISLRTDDDGNTMATYYLGANETIDISFTGHARITSRYPTLVSDKKSDSIPEDLVDLYTGRQRYWETDDPELVAIANEITDPSKPVVENARAIYDYVVSKLKYNTLRINEDLKRMGAADALKEPENAVCMEFTDLYIALARIAGIPAREIDGYAYTSDSGNQPIYYPGLGSDILHAWVQVYLPDDGWVTIDPTWGSTTGGVDFFSRIDLNRIAFVVKGLSSESPYAAGSYKTSEEQDGDVSVSFSKDTATADSAFTLSMDRTTLTAGIGNALPVVIENTGNVALYNIDLQASATSPLNVDASQLADDLHILPGQKTTIWLPLNSESWLDGASTTLSLFAEAHDQQNNKAELSRDFTIQIQPFYLAVVLPILGSILAVIAVAAAAWYGLHLYHDRQKNKQASSSTSH